MDSENCTSIRGKRSFITRFQSSFRVNFRTNIQTRYFSIGFVFIRIKKHYIRTIGGHRLNKIDYLYILHYINN